MSRASTGAARSARGFGLVEWMRCKTPHAHGFGFAEPASLCGRSTIALRPYVTAAPPPASEHCPECKAIEQQEKQS